MMITIDYRPTVARKVSELLRGKGVNTHGAILFLLYLQERGAGEGWVAIRSSEIEEDILLNIQQQIRIRKAIREAGLIEERRGHKESGWGWSPTEYRLTDKWRALIQEV